MQPNQVPESLVEQGKERAAVYLSAASWLPLEDFCEKLGAIMHLPSFEYDGENEYQWGFVQLENGCVEINISCLNEPNLTMPIEYTVSLMVAKIAAPGLDKNWLKQNLMPDVENGIRLLEKTK